MPCTFVCSKGHERKVPDVDTRASHSTITISMDDGCPECREQMFQESAKTMLDRQYSFTEIVSALSKL